MAIEANTLPGGPPTPKPHLPGKIVLITETTTILLDDGKVQYHYKVLLDNDELWVLCYRGTLFVGQEFVSSIREE